MKSNNGLNKVQTVRRNSLTARSQKLDNKGQANLQAGNKEKAYKQFAKSDKLVEKRASLTSKAVSKNNANATKKAQAAAKSASTNLKGSNPFQRN